MHLLLYHVSLCLVYLSTLIAPSTTINVCMCLIPLKSIFYTLIRLASSVYGTSAICLSMSSYFWSPPGYSWLSIYIASHWAFCMRIYTMSVHWFLWLLNLITCIQTCIDAVFQFHTNCGWQKLCVCNVISCLMSIWEASLWKWVGQISDFFCWTCVIVPVVCVYISWALVLSYSIKDMTNV